MHTPILGYNNTQIMRQSGRGHYPHTLYSEKQMIELHIVTELCKVAVFSFQQCRLATVILLSQDRAGAVGVGL